MTAGVTLTQSLLPMLGLHPLLGRGFRDGDDAPGAPGVVMITDRLWERRFGADPPQIGKSIQLNGVPYTIVGIAPPGPEILSGPADIYAPLTVDRAKELRLNHTIFAMARLKAGVSINRAQAAMIDIARQVGSAYPEVKDWSVSLLGFDRWLIGDQIRTALLVLLGAVGWSC